MKDNNLMNLIIESLKKNKGKMILDVLFFCILTLIIAVFPYIQKQFIDMVQYSNVSIQNVLNLIIEYTMTVGLYVISNYWGTINEVKFYSSFIKDFRQLTSQWIFRSFDYKENKANYVSVLTTEINKISDEFVGPILDLIENLAGITIYFIFIFFLVSKYAAIVLLALSCILYCVSGTLSSSIGESRKKYMSKERNYLTFITNLFDHFSIINQRNISFVQTRYNRYANEVYESNCMLGRRKAASLTFNHSCSYLISLITFVSMLMLFVTGKQSLGSVVASIGYVDVFMDAIGRVIDDRLMISSFKKNGLIELKGRYVENKNTNEDKIKNIRIKSLTLENGGKAIEYKSIGFYRNKSYCITGSNGCGKSTLLKGLVGITKIVSGNILINGIERTDQEYEDLYYIDQNVSILIGDFNDNVTMYGAYNIDSLLKLNFYKKIENKLGKQSSCINLSGGEKQLVALCRAIASGATTLLIDEGFNSIDLQTRTEIIIELIAEKYFLIYVSHDGKDKELFDEELILK